MLRSRLFLFACWAATTVAATVISAAGVSIVTRDVTDDHAPALRGGDVIALLDAPLPEPTPTTSAPPETAPSPPPVPSAPPETAPSTTPPSTPPPATTVPPSTQPPRPSAPPPTVLALADAVGGTFSAGGGTMTVACLGDTIALVSARPNDGFRLVVEAQGSTRVRVRFARDGDGPDDELAAACRRGEPVLREGNGDDRARGEDDDEDEDEDEDRDGGGRDGGSRSGDDDDRDGRGSGGRGG